MSYSSIVEMVNSASLRGRITACVAAEGIDNPEAWMNTNIWVICQQIGDTDWAYAVATATVNVNPDTGGRDDVVSDQDILSAVQALQV